MKTRKLVFSCSALAVLTMVGMAGYSHGEVDTKATLSAHTATADWTTYFDGNSLLMYVSNQGSFAYDDLGVSGTNAGLCYPAGSGIPLLYASGLWMGAKVNGGVRVAIAEYGQDFSPCPMINGTFRPDDDSCRVYKINQGDTRLTNPDYADWPFHWGAPSAKDYFGNDSLDEQGRLVPLLKGKQALWTVFNDANPAYHDAGATLPLGIEVRLYVYGDDLTCQSGNTAFLEYTIINEGVNTLTDTYISLWADPDIGNAGDDLVGCQPEKSLGFAYNDSADGLAYPFPPAVGFRLLHGPTVPSPGEAGWQSGLGRWVLDQKNLPMTAFLKYINGTDPDSPSEIYNYMRGLEADGTPIIDPTTGLPTTFMVSGNPLDYSGWVDSEPTDRRFMVTTGPIVMAPGDTQAVTLAVMAAVGTHRLGFWGVDTVVASHTAGTSDGSAFAVILDPDQTTGHDYRISFQLSPSQDRYDWDLRDQTAGTDLVTAWPNQSGDDNYPIVDGMVIKVLSPRPGVGGWDVPNGTRKITWVGGADGIFFEGFYGAIGWASPASVFGDGRQGVPITELKNVLLKFAPVDLAGQFDPSDPNVSYAYRYGRSFANPPARPEFAPFIINQEPLYSFQQFGKSIPLSAWNVDSDPPRRLVVGHLENNVPGGMVDGKWWPPASNLADNVASDGPREWLWIYDADYSETYDPALGVETIENPLPIMYFLTVARRNEVPFEAGDEFLIIRSNFNTDADLFEFTVPPPTAVPEIPGKGSCHPMDSLRSLVELREADSLAHERFLAEACRCVFAANGNGDAWVDAVDLAILIDAMYFSGPVVHDALCPRVRYDLDCDGDMDGVDFQYMIDYVFFNGVEPCDPCAGLTIPY